MSANAFIENWQSNVFSDFESTVLTTSEDSSVYKVSEPRTTLLVCLPSYLFTKHIEILPGFVLLIAKDHQHLAASLTQPALRGLVVGTSTAGGDLDLLHVPSRLLVLLGCGRRWRLVRVEGWTVIRVAVVGASAPLFARVDVEIRQCGPQLMHLAHRVEVELPCRWTAFAACSVGRTKRGSELTIMHDTEHVHASRRNHLALHAHLGQPGLLAPLLTRRRLLILQPVVLDLRCAE
jgi:hypothetical protein